MGCLSTSGRSSDDCRSRAEAEAKLAELARQQESAIAAELRRRNDLDAASAQVRCVTRRD